MKKDLTRGSITAALCSFAAPMILGNLLQQAYNLGDTLVVGRCLGDNALADVMSLSLLMIGATAVIIELAALAFRPQILRLLKTPAEIMSLTSDYVRIILIGICFIFLYNYYSFMLCGLGDSVTPLVFLGISSAVNILLDILFVAKFSMGIKGAAWATLISQALAGAGLAVFSLVRESSLRPQFCRRLLSRSLFGEVTRMSSAACVQQSVMNFGILMIQGLVNSFGTRVILVYALSPAVGVVGIWWSIPIGWFLADIVGAAIMRRSMKTLGDT